MAWAAGPVDLKRDQEASMKRVFKIYPDHKTKIRQLADLAFELESGDVSGR